MPWDDRSLARGRRRAKRALEVAVLHQTNSLRASPSSSTAVVAPISGVALEFFRARIIHGIHTGRATSRANSRHPSLFPPKPTEHLSIQPGLNEIGGRAPFTAVQAPAHSHGAAAALEEHRHRYSPARLARLEGSLSSGRHVQALAHRLPLGTSRPGAPHTWHKNDSAELRRRQMSSPDFDPAKVRLLKYFRSFVVSKYSARRRCNQSRRFGNRGKRSQCRPKCRSFLVPVAVWFNPSHQGSNELHRARFREIVRYTTAAPTAQIPPVCVNRSPPPL